MIVLVFVNYFFTIGGNLSVFVNVILFIFSRNMLVSCINNNIHVLLIWGSLLLGGGSIDLQRLTRLCFDIENGSEDLCFSSKNVEILC